MPRRFILISRWLLFFCCAGWLLPVHAWSFLNDRSGTHVPAVGKLLVAMPGLDSPRFSATVILLLRYSPAGAAGLIINRPTRITLAAEFEGQISESQSREALFWGGPVEMDKRLMLVEKSAGVESSETLVPVLETLYLTNDLSQLQQPQDQRSPRFRIFAGYAGWTRSQLEREIENGDWLVLPGTVERVLQADTRAIWPQLIYPQRGRIAASSINPGQVSLRVAFAR
ncbi:MAG: YqgE/AlgH family protein [Motiliproteus sp.]